MDRILLKNLELYGYHGYYREENVLGQRFWLTIEAFADLKVAGLSGELDDSVNYVEIFETAKDIFNSKKYKLLEELSFDIGQAILKNFKIIKNVTVEIMKPEIPVPVTCDYFSIKREFKREETAYIALGSNLGDREGYLNSAIRQLKFHKDIEVTAISSVYETEPVGYEEQDKFLNMVVKVKTSLDPMTLLKYCNHIEGNLLRKRDVRWGPRTIDIDILIYDDYSSDDDILTLPHPRMTDRAFVMLPLADVSEEGLLINGKNIEEIINDLSHKGIEHYKNYLAE